MAHRFAVLDDGRLLLVVFQGSIDAEEEAATLVEAGALPGLRKDACILVDRRTARMAVGPEDVRPQLDLARNVFANADRPRLAMVVAADYDFGMARMLELRGGTDTPHEVRVFRDLAQACAWLGVDPSVLPPEDAPEPGA